MANIVVLEDDLKLAGQIKESLEAVGHQVVTFGSNGPAIAHIEKASLDLLIADLFIKENKTDIVFGGISLMSYVRQIRKLSVPIIAISGTFSSEIKIEAIQTSRTVGATETLAKPFHPDTLIDLVNQLLDTKIGRPQLRQVT